MYVFLECTPIWPGYRHVRLRTSTNQPLDMATLFIYSSTTKQPWAGRKVATEEKHCKKKLAVKPSKAPVCDSDSSRRLSRPWSYVSRPKTKRISLMPRSNSAGLILLPAAGGRSASGAQSLGEGMPGRDFGGEVSQLKRHLSDHSNISHSTSTSSNLDISHSTSTSSNLDISHSTSKSSNLDISHSTSKSSNLDISWDMGTASSLEGIGSTATSPNIPSEGKSRQEGRLTQSIPISIPSRALGIPGDESRSAADFGCHVSPSVNSDVTRLNLSSSKWAHSSALQEIAQTKHPNWLLARCCGNGVAERSSARGHYTQLSLPSTLDILDAETGTGDTTQGDSLHDAGGTHTQDAGDTHTQDAGGTHTQDAGDTHTQDAGDTHTQDAGGTHTQDAGDTHTQDAGDTHTQDAGDTHTQDAGGTHTQDAGVTHTQDAGDTHTQDVGDTHTQDAGGTHTQDAGGTHTQDAGDTHTQADVSRRTRPTMSSECPGPCRHVTADHQGHTCSYCQQPYVLSCHKQVICANISVVNQGMSVSCPPAMPTGRVGDLGSNKVQGDIRWDGSSVLTSLKTACTPSLLGDTQNMCHSCVTEDSCGYGVSLREADIGKQEEFNVSSSARQWQKKVISCRQQKVFARQTTLCDDSSWEPGSECRQDDIIDTMSHIHEAHIAVEAEHTTSSDAELCSHTSTDLGNMSSHVIYRRNPCVESVSSEEETLCQSEKNRFNYQSSDMQYSGTETSEFVLHNVERCPSNSDICEQFSPARSYSYDTLDRTKDYCSPEPNQHKFKTFAAAAKELIRQKTHSAFSLLVSSLRRPGSHRKSYRLCASADPLVEGHRHSSKTSFSFLSLRQQTRSSVRLNYLRQLFQSEGHKQVVEDDLDTFVESNTDSCDGLVFTDIPHKKKTKSHSDGDIHSVNRCRSTTPSMPLKHSDRPGNDTVTELGSLHNDIVTKSYLDGKSVEALSEWMGSLTRKDHNVDISQSSSPHELCLHMTHSCSELPEGLEVEEALSSSVIQETVL
ncbi:hypothetical protein LSAT2_026961 [Lamellibrachia satsuma]|nr:hypothetical protein LSAT2_026961 [Lamellibrachia satsuma]